MVNIRLVQWGLVSFGAMCMHSSGSHDAPGHAHSHIPIWMNHHIEGMGNRMYCHEGLDSCVWGPLWSMEVWNSAPLEKLGWWLGDVCLGCVWGFIQVKGTFATLCQTPMYSQ